jgi:hypothetical protein
MKIITRFTKAAEAAEKWKGGYCRQGVWSVIARNSSQEVYEALAALGPTPEPDAVNAVIGNDSWTMPPSCDECGEKKEIVVQMGEEPDYESSTADLCRECLGKAVLALHQWPEPLPSSMPPR